MKRTRKQLKARISELENELAELRREASVSAIIKNANLPKCESKICRGCIHAAIEYQYGRYILQGCSKNLDCKDYVARERIIVIDRQEQLPDRLRQ